METNPYAPPKAAIADLSSTGLKRRSVLLMIVFAVVTFGLYYPIWFLRRRAALNELDSPRKLPTWPFVVFIVWFVVQFMLGAQPLRRLSKNYLVKGRSCFSTSFNWQLAFSCWFKAS